MNVLRVGRPSRCAAAVASLLACCAAFAAPAAAETLSYDLGDQPVIVLQARGAGNDLTVRTWDRPSIEIDYAGEAPQIERRSVPYGTLRNPVVAQIPPIPVHEPGAPPHGGFPPPGFPPGAPLPPFPPDVAILPPEEFPFAGFRPGTHDWVRVVTDGAARLTVTL
ncbi:MAG: hypothetical protein JOZ24_05945, partial [Candidatus Eremiobacteraeota bacterium]|nr:hypothetical protein [Candidatus Eremiobacteraeota bacterium]